METTFLCDFGGKEIIVKAWLRESKNFKYHRNYRKLGEEINSYLEETSGLVLLITELALACLQHKSN